MDLGPPITSRTNARVKALRASLSGRAAVAGDLLGIEGEHLIAEAARSGIALDTVFVREGSESLLQRSSLANVQPKHWVLLSADVFDSAMETASPQGLAATLQVPENRIAAPGLNGPVLVLEDLQDPGNLGTLLRSAEAFGASMVMMTPHTANPWNSKVVRSSVGSVFRLPLMRAPLAEIRKRLTELGLPLFAAVVRQEKAAPITSVDLASCCALMIGNEGAGLSPDALALADALITIPCAIESLNAAVAGSTLLYEAMRQRSLREAGQ